MAELAELTHDEGPTCETPRTLRRADVVAEARRWLGTPYHHQASLMGVGADCLGLVRGVYRALHGCEAEPAPAYSPDWGEASGEETLLKAARRNLVQREAGALDVGDVIVFRMRRGAVAKHAAIVSAASTMVHAVEGIGVVEVPLAQWWKRRIAGVFSFHGIED